MPAITKRVNIKATVPVRNINPPIYGTCKDITMTTGDILKCLCVRAIVDEILPDGSTIRLSMKNYNLDNAAHLNTKTVEPEVVKLDEIIFDTDKVEDSIVTTSEDTDNVSDETAEIETEVDPSDIENADSNTTNENTNTVDDENAQEDIADSNDDTVYNGTVCTEADIAEQDRPTSTTVVAETVAETDKASANTNNTPKKKSSNNNKKKK